MPLQFIFLFLKNSYSGLHSDVLFESLVEILLKLQTLRVKTLFVLIYFFGKNAREIISGEIWLHQFYIFTMISLSIIILLLEVVRTALSPKSFMTWLSWLRSTLLLILITFSLSVLSNRNIIMFKIYFATCIDMYFILIQNQ